MSIIGIIYLVSFAVNRQFYGVKCQEPQKEYLFQNTSYILEYDSTILILINLGLGDP